MWLTFFYVSIAIVCVICALVSLRSVRFAGHELELQAAQLRSIESRLRSVEDSNNEQLQLVAKVANSQKMQRVRAATEHATKVGSNGEPDVRSDPEAWRAWQNKQLKTGVVN